MVVTFHGQHMSLGYRPESAHWAGEEHVFVLGFTTNIDILKYPEKMKVSIYFVASSIFKRDGQSLLLDFHNYILYILD